MTKLFHNKSSVLFATFAVYIKGEMLHANGMINQMHEYFLVKAQSFSVLIQPHPGSDRISPVLYLYKGLTKLKEKKMPPIVYLPLYLICYIQNYDDTHISFKVRDFLSVLYFGLTGNKKYDWFIGLECINAIAGIVLKKIGRVRYVIYYVSDYADKRYQIGFINSIYHYLDAFCVMHADFTWDVSPAMKEGRVKAGFISSDSQKIIHVPNGLFPSQIDSIPIAKRIPHSIVYMGLLNPDQHGVDIALKAFCIILKKYPDATFHVIGGTNRETNPFMDMVKELKIGKSVINHGFLPPNQKMSQVIGTCSIGVATYRLDKNPRNKYGDSGKIHQYLGCGLPIVATTIQWYTKYAIDQGAGIGAAETPESFAKAIMKLFEDKKLYESCSKKAVQLSRKNTWENTYSNAFKVMNEVEGNKFIS